MILLSTHPKHIFISYALKDGAALGKRVHEDLTKSGFAVWFDTRSSIPGATWDTQIETALQKADVVLAILTLAFEKSVTCHDEINFALRLGKQIIPLLASAEMQVPFRLDRL